MLASVRINLPPQLFTCLNVMFAFNGWIYASMKYKVEFSYFGGAWNNSYSRRSYLFAFWGFQLWFI